MQMEMFPSKTPKKRPQYAYTIKTTRVKERDFPYHGRSVTCTWELVDFCKCLRDMDIERFVVIYLDAKNHIIGLKVVDGTVDQAVVYPREVVRHALLLSAASMILMHNHPSGNARPSEPDISLTKRLLDVATFLNLHIHDHIIMAGDEWTSFRESGLVSFS